MIRTKLIQLYGHQGFRRYAGNTSWLFGEKALRMAVGLFVGVWVARYLGPERFGIFNYAQSFVGLFAAIATLGLDSIVVRELVKGALRKEELLATAFWLKIMGAFLVILILAIAINFTSNDNFTNILVFIIASSSFFQAFNVIDMHFQALVLSKYVVYANVVTLLVSSITKIVLISIDAPLIAFAWITLVDSLILSCGLIYNYLKNETISINKLKFKLDISVVLLKESWPLIFASVASMINMRVDQVILGNMTTYKVVGNYAAAIRISELWFIIPSVLASSLYPSIISAKNVSHSFYRSRIIKTVKYMAFFALTFAVIITFASSTIVGLLYGDSFKDADLFLSVHIWSGVPYVIFFSYAQVATIEKKTTIHLYTAVFTVSLNVLLNYLLIPLYSGLGAAVSTMCVAWFTMLLAIYLIETKVGIFISKEK